MLRFKDDKDIARLVENFNIVDPKKTDAGNFSRLLTEMVEEALEEHNIKFRFEEDDSTPQEMRATKEVDITTHDKAGSRDERAEQYLVDGCIAGATGVLKPGEDFRFPLDTEGKFGKIDSDYKEKNQKKPKKLASYEPEGDYAKKPFAIGVKIAASWTGPQITADNTKVLGASKATLTPEYAAIGAQPTSVTDIIIGGIKMSVKEAAGSQVTVMEPSNYPLVFKQAYREYKDKGGKIDLDAVIKGLGDPMSVLGMSGKDLQQKMVVKVLDEYKDAFDPATIAKRMAMKTTDKKTYGVSPEATGGAAKRGNIINAIFGLKQSKRADAAASVEAQQALIKEVVGEQANELVPLMVEALRTKYVALFEDPTFKTQIVKELLTGAGKFAPDKEGNPSSAVADHMLFFSASEGKYKITPINEDYLKENLKHYKWNLRAGKGNVYRKIDNVVTFVGKRKGAFRVDMVDVSKEIDDTLKLAAKEKGTTPEEIQESLLEEGFLDGIKDFGKNMMNKVKQGFQSFRKWVSNIAQETLAGVGKLFTSEIKSPEDVLEKGYLDLDVQFTPVAPDAELDNSVELAE